MVDFIVIGSILNVLLVALYFNFLFVMLPDQVAGRTFPRQDSAGALAVATRTSSKWAEKGLAL